MKVSKLKLIYPSAIESSLPADDNNIFNYFDGETYLHLEKAKLKTEELSLLNSMMNKKSINSDWYDFLVKEKKSLPQDLDKLQCIHFHTKKVKQNQEQWLSSFKSFFDNVIDSFFISTEYGVIILESYNKTKEQLQGFVYMLDDDFSTTTSIFIGISTSSENLKEIFKEEQDLFIKSMKTGNIRNFIDAYIPHYIAPQLKESFISQQIRESIVSDDQLIRLIRSLWKNQGNQSAAAQELFIHRNTINYQIDKLISEHNLNLRDMQQLLLCYLLTL